ncbi:MAG: Sll0314/Alr1548 family TPR repeat-containing protein [Leptolyngbyaceae bacterium]|nr:Sll0314/Alr1548 family TPR repeat-containing protein [Leptolyngbyaceae bacterium]
MKKTAMKRIGSCAAGMMAIALPLLSSPVLADPFRTTNPRSFDPSLDAAFVEMFRNGNYVAAEELLASASPADPMTHAMQAAFAYLESDWDTLNTEAEQTLAAAESLVSSDPLRGNLYIAVGHFMEGAHVLSTRGTVQATPIVLSKLRLVFTHMGLAEEVDAQDPELNLIKGYMDLMIAVNLPFSSPDQAIERLQTYGSPSYLVQRGLAVAYRDLDNLDAAMDAVDRAIADAPTNPDLFYLKAQILRLRGDLRESLEHFDQTLEQADNYPDPLAEQIAYERCRTQNDLQEQSESGEVTRNCRAWAQRRIAQGAESSDDSPSPATETSLNNSSETLPAGSTES